MVPTRADRIRFAAVKSFVLPVLDDGEVRFTIADACTKLPFPFAQHQHIRGALQAEKPLAIYGIAWVQADGYATQHQEIKWTWDPKDRILNRILSEGWSVENVLQEAYWSPLR